MLNDWDSFAFDGFLFLTAEAKQAGVRNVAPEPGTCQESKNTREGQGHACWNSLVTTFRPERKIWLHLLEKKKFHR